MTLTVCGRAIGSRRPLFADWSVPIDPDDVGGRSGLTLRDLIALIVRAEIESYVIRHEARRLDRVLSRKDIDTGDAAGRIAPEARESPAPPNFDEALDTALQAFEDGLYLVVIDGCEMQDLDAQVFVKPESRITFVRLVFLAGA